MMRKLLAVLATAAALVTAGAGIAAATPSAPTNGGNGAGLSGQCTGPALDRPASCESSK